MKTGPKTQPLDSWLNQKAQINMTLPKGSAFLREPSAAFEDLLFGTTAHTKQSLS